ncbi:retrovirus-related pol polyprotein from transposon TNT 1-94 [Tanacetum coccineum]
MFEDLKHVQLLEKEVDDLQKNFDDFKSQIENENVSSRVDDLLLQEFLAKDILCDMYTSMLDTDNYCDMACKYLDKIKEYINDVNARTKKPEIMPISNRKPTKNENQSVTTQHHITIASETTIHKSSSYFRMLYEKTSKALTWWIEKQCPSGYIWKPKGNELLTGTHRYDLYIISLQESSSPTLICFMAKASLTQAWLWHHCLSHLNFYTINLLSKNDIVNGLPKLKYVNDQLCSSCKMGKAKRSNFKTKTIPSSKGWLHLLHMDLCGPMWVESINGKKYILVIVDDYSRYTWTYFMRSKDKIPEVLIDFLKMIQHGLQAQVINVQTNKVMRSLGWLLEEIHITWAHLEKKRTRLQLYTKSHEENAYSGWRRRHDSL